MAENVMNSTFEYIFFFSSEVGPTRAIKTANFRGTFDNLYSSTINVNEFADVHGAAFPLKFAEHFIGAFCQSVCYEPFSGTGTTLVACENLGRHCRAVEISPAYVAVALERMSQAHPHLAIVRLDAGG
jgi:DNA modification methylase